MFRKVATAAVALAMFSTLSSAAEAQFGIPDVYVAASAGGVYPETFDITERATSTVVEADPVAGYLLSGAAGADFGLFRLEGELLFNRNELDDLNGFSGNVDGHFATLAGMANAFVDIPTGLGITPFAGAGVGYASVDAKVSNSGADLLDDSDGGLAWQLRAGVALGLLPFTDLTIGYRYLVVQDLDMKNATGRVETDEQRSHVAEIGIRFSF